MDAKGEIRYVNPQSHYRLGTEIFLLGLFALLLLVFGGWAGLKALLSFLFSALMIWKVLVPLMLKGADPVLLSLGTVAAMSAVIIFLVAGPTRKGVVAFPGAFLGVQGVPLANLFNLIYVAAEVLKTLVDSFGLVTVAPFTALAGGVIFTRSRKKNPSDQGDS